MQTTTKPAPAAGSCHGAAQLFDTDKAQGTIILAGKPNVGKSVLFGRLTGHYTSVSNYPGTTVDIARGSLMAAGKEYRLLDTPGIYSLSPLSEEERVARDLLRETPAQLVVQVADAKNLELVLPFTLQLIDAGLPTVLVLNMMDEARSHGLRIDARRLSEELGIPVVPTTATSGEGVDELLRLIAEEYATDARSSADSQVADAPPAVRYSDAIEKAIAELEHLAAGDGSFSARAEAILLLRGDEGSLRRLWERDEAAGRRLAELRERLERELGSKLAFALAVEERRIATDIAQKVFTKGQGGRRIRERLSALTMRPLTGIPILMLVLYFGFYRFVGVFGAGTVVDYLEATLFDEILNPFFTAISQQTIPWPVIQQLFTGEYGILTMGLKYAIAIILPVVAFFFIIFSIIEDSGYLPRLAMLLDKIFKKIGLSGRAVIPMVLGLGCSTMATMVTRTLGTRRERVISTLLLALAVPCSAQLGVMLAILSGTGAAIWIWLATVAILFLVVGRVASLLMPGRAPTFYMEIPPLRMPRLGNVLNKTYTRVFWYIREIVPIFLIASTLIWLGQITGVFGMLIQLLSHPLRLMGLPAEAGTVFLFGFFRRDYGAAGLYELAANGVLSSAQITIAAVALTLFLPCIAQFLINIKERGIKTGLAISGVVLGISFLAGVVLHQLYRIGGAL
jgi:ferrous iron transport protein B